MITCAIVGSVMAVKTASNMSKKRKLKKLKKKRAREALISGANNNYNNNNNNNNNSDTSSSTLQSINTERYYGKSSISDNDDQSSFFTDTNSSHPSLSSPPSYLSNESIRKHYTNNINNNYSNNNNNNRCDDSTINSYNAYAIPTYLSTSEDFGYQFENTNNYNYNNLNNNNLKLDINKFDFTNENLSHLTIKSNYKGIFDIIFNTFNNKIISLTGIDYPEISLQTTENNDNDNWEEDAMSYMVRLSNRKIIGIKILVGNLIINGKNQFCIYALNFKFNDNNDVWAGNKDPPTNYTTHYFEIEENRRLIMISACHDLRSIRGINFSSA